MFTTLVRRLHRWRLRRTTVRHLNWLDDHLLEDIGTSRSDIEGFVDKTLP